MAERRMFSTKLVSSDQFLEMNLSAQALYFHLGLQADDDGFVSNPKSVQRMIGAKSEDLQELIISGFIYQFDSGIIVIRHWKMQNTIQADRRKETIHQAEKKMLSLDASRVYIKKDTKWKQSVSRMETQYSIGKVREEEQGEEGEALLGDLQIDDLRNLEPEDLYAGIITMSPKESMDEMIRSLRVYMNHVGFNPMDAEKYGGINSWLKVLLKNDSIDIEALLKAIKDTAEIDPENHVECVMDLMFNKGKV